MAELLIGADLITSGWFSCLTKMNWFQQWTKCSDFLQVTSSKKEINIKKAPTGAFFMFISFYTGAGPVLSRTTIDGVKFVMMSFSCLRLLRALLNSKRAACSEITLLAW